MKCAITAQSAQTAQTAQLHLGNNRTLALCPDCAFHKFVLIALIALFALIAHFIPFSLLILTFHGVNG